MDADIAALTRRARRATSELEADRCETCAATEHLTRLESGVACYECLSRAAGRSGVELDHLAGRANIGGLLIALRANDHRTITEMRLDLGLDRWPTAGDEPFLQLAHVLAGIASLLVLLADWLVRFVTHAGQPAAPAFPVVS